MHPLDQAHIYLFTTHLTRNKEIAIVVAIALVAVGLGWWLLRRRARV